MHHLEQIELESTSTLNAILIHEATELVHIVGLLSEEIQGLIQDEKPVHKGDLAQLTGYIQEELIRMRQVLAAAVIGHEIHHHAASDQVKLLVIEKDDNIGTIIGSTVKAGEEIITNGRMTELHIVAQHDLPAGSKIALTDLAIGDKVIKYGVAVGTAIQTIKAGEAIHEHNFKPA